jgi:hypothetical protein
MHTKEMSDSSGSFNNFEFQQGVLCRKCNTESVSVRLWESSCGGYEDYHFKCNNCNHSWWIEGIDS